MTEVPPRGRRVPHCSVITLALLLVAVAPALLVVPLDGRPVRFGAPLPLSVLSSGLRLEGKGTLQWRRLPIGKADADPVWIEIAITGPPGTVRICAGGGGPHADGRGPAFVRDETEEVRLEGRERVERWHWSCGTVDVRTRLSFTAATTIDGETFASGEARTICSEGFAERAAVVCRLPRATYVSCGLMPPLGGGGAVTKALRAHVARVLPRLCELPGVRGAGDYARSGGVVTNLEFDTPLALLHCAIGLADAHCFVRARRSAQHLLDRDIDARSGLPFPHGTDHRLGQPEPGHTWLQGLLWQGLLAADDAHLVAAHNLGLALAACPPTGTGPRERLRDYAWPLLELETLLTAAEDPQIARAADRLATSISRRFDAVARTFRFGEGEVGGGVYFERGWLSGGLLLPALRRHLARRANARLSDQVAAVEGMLIDRIGKHGQGLPTHWRVVGPTAFAEHREEGTAEAAFLLEVLAPVDLQRLLRRATVRAAITAMPNPDDPDLATQLTLLARCQWLWR